MKRINVTFFDETFEKLEERMKKNGDKSIANGIRELVDLGMKLEAAADKFDGKSNGKDDLAALIDMLKNNLIWSLETRLLTRHLVEKIPSTEEGSDTNILEKCKERASNYVMGMLGDAVK